MAIKPWHSLVRLGLGLLIATVAVGLSARQAGVGNANDDPTYRFLNGAIDIHVHSFPDNAERAIDGIEAAMMAKAYGMRGLVLKNHYDPTAGLAYLARKQVPGIEVF